MFSGCTNLTNMDKYVFGYSVSNGSILSGLYKTCLYYDRVFYNCSKLMNAPYCELYNKYGVYLDLPLPVMFNPFVQNTIDGFPSMDALSYMQCYRNCTGLQEYQELYDSYPNWF